MADAFRATYGLGLEARELPRVVRFGSWIGGDRDGNPFVTPGCTRDALRMARETGLDFYAASVDELHERLSSSTKQAPASRALVEALEESERRLPAAASRPFAPHAPEEVYRRFLSLVLRRLSGTREAPGAGGDASDAYSNAGEFTADLRLLRESLAEGGALRLA